MNNYLKAIPEKSNDTELRVGNHIVLFGGKDLHGEHFTAETKFDSDYTKHNAVLVDWEHGFDPDPDSPNSDDLLGYVDWSTAKSTDYGLWVERVLDRSKEYMQYVEELIEAGIVGTSSEAVPRGIRRSESGEIQVWPIKRDSLTVQPAEPRMLTSNALEALKSLLKYSPALSALIPPEGGQETAVDDAATAGEPLIETSKSKEVNIMTDAVNVITRDEFQRAFDDVKAELETVKGLSAGVNIILEKLEQMPAAKTAGLVAPDSETDERDVKSFADFCVAVRNNNVRRLTEVYHTRKDLSGETGTAGGYLVPEQYETTLLQVAAMASAIMQRVTRVPVGTDRGKWPALDQYVTPTAGSGQTAEAAGVRATTTAAGATLTETEPGFEMIEWRINKVGGFTEVENELIADSPQAIGVLLERLFGIAVANKNERNILRGTGVGEPLGILSAACAVGVTPATNNVFAYADALNMKSRFKAVGGTPMWLWHPGIWPDVGIFETSAGGGVFMANLAAGAPGRLLGYEYGESQHQPQDDNSGCVLLADFSAYLFFERAGLAVAFSEHAAFTSDKGTWRFTQRNDGQPWLRLAITLADPQGSYTVSPFVFLND